MQDDNAGKMCWCTLNFQQHQVPKAPDNQNSEIFLINPSYSIDFML